MRIYAVICLLLVSTFSCKEKESVAPEACNNGLSYYANDRLVTVPSSINRLYINFGQPGMSLAKAQEAILEHQEIQTKVVIPFTPDSTRSIIELADGLDCRAVNNLLHKLNADPRLYYATPELPFETGGRVILTNEISAIPKDGVDVAAWEAEVRGLGLVIKEKYDFGYRIVVPDLVDGYESAAKSKILYEKGLSKWASPNVLAEIVLHNR